MAITPNKDPIDIYTAAHYSLGLVYGTTRVPWYVPLVLSMGFEFLERYAKVADPGVFPVATQDSLANSVVDIIAVMLGWAASKGAINYYVRRKQAV